MLKPGVPSSGLAYWIESLDACHEENHRIPDQIQGTRPTDGLPGSAIDVLTKLPIVRNASNL